MKHCFSLFRELMSYYALIAISDCLHSLFDCGENWTTNAFVRPNCFILFVF